MDHWTQQLRAHWGILANLLQLDGEYDLNFLAETENDSGYIVKVMRPDCEDWLVDMQVQAMDHIEKIDPNLPCPKVIPSLSGQPHLAVSDKNGVKRIVWVIERLPGKCYARSAPKTDALIHEFGRILGRTNAALKTFNHPNLARDFKWNLTQADWIGPKLDCITDPARRSLLADVHSKFTLTKPFLDGLETQAIHNDANDYNILVDGPLGKPQNLNHNQHRLALTGHSIRATASYMTSAAARMLAYGCTLITPPSMWQHFALPFGPILLCR